MIHTPVLPLEVLALLQPQAGELFVDGTLGFGGHSRLLLEKGVRLIGIDQDIDALAEAKKLLGPSVTYIQGNFGNLAELLADTSPVDGILLDIGVSSYQLDTPERGFSFQENGPLDMRMDQEGLETAADIVNHWPEPKLVELFFQLGEERLSRKIARFIVERRQKEPFRTTSQLADLIVSAYPPPARYKKPHPATRVFQALRIEVNQELEVLKSGIEQALAKLAPGGRLAIISFHSLEDRIVKHAFREAAASEEFKLLTKKPIMAGEEEREENPRSRSAKLRGIQRI